MKLLDTQYFNLVSGATRWSSDVPDWGSLPYSPIPDAPASGAQIDYFLMSILMGNAALFGCVNGSLKGGLYGCITSGSIAGIGAMYAYIAADAYKSYASNKK